MVRIDPAATAVIIETAASDNRPRRRIRVSKCPGHDENPTPESEYKTGDFPLSFMPTVLDNLSRKFERTIAARILFLRFFAPA